MSHAAVAHSSKVRSAMAPSKSRTLESAGVSVPADVVPALRQVFMHYASLGGKANYQVCLKHDRAWCRGAGYARVLGELVVTPSTQQCERCWCNTAIEIWANNASHGPHPRGPPATQ